MLGSAAGPPGGSFHPAVRTWFERRFPDGPTEPQAAGWREIAVGGHTLIAAPTGSGKTLAAFLVCIDRLYRAYEAGGEPATRPEAQANQAPGPQVVYVSPLKALAVDIQQNLEAPLREIAAVAAELGMSAPDVRVAVRTGDTAMAERAAMLRRPPDFLITTPESLYLLVTAERSRAILRHVRTVIIDEIHAIAGNKRGSHLALTLERVAHVADAGVQRIGLSATQRPIEAIARLLIGAGPDRSRPDGTPDCAIVDTGHRRALDLALELPDDEMGAVATAEQMAQILEMITGHVRQHRTTLVFVNTRRMAERVAHELGERLGEEMGAKVAAHHGSLSRDRRHRVERRLREGDLRALVATASLELGIDIGPVELVCQIGSPRSFATFLQRVGRSNHTRTGTPAGRLYPTSRDELVECAAMLRGIKTGRLDAIVIPRAPLDILGQQMVAECAAQLWQADELYDLVRRAAPYSDLPREDFDDVAEMLAEGIRTGRGRRAYYLHRDQVNGTLKARRGARLAALTSGGAIPELGDFKVIADPDETVLGTVSEDWATESSAGDIFLLGTHSWRIRRIERGGAVRVVDAQGAPPSVPFWRGEAPGRTRELSEEVSTLRKAVADRSAKDARGWLITECGVGQAAAETIVSYLHAGLAALGALPTMDTIIFERFFDDAGGMQLVGHAPFGARLNRAFGLALRKRFCVTFDFELEASASDNAILLSLGPQHSFPLDRVPKFLASASVEQVVRQAVLTAPLFQSRWRWNLNTSLTVLRMRGGKKNPPAIQRMESDDLMAAVFPVLAACQENVAPGPMEIPDHTLVRQTLTDCLHEAMDIDGLRELVSGIEAGRIKVITRDTTEPSVLAHEIINGQPFTYLDDGEFENRRSRNVRVPRGLPVDARDLARLDSDAIQRVREEVKPQPRDADELHDLLLTLYLMHPEPAWAEMFDELARAGRVGVIDGMWCATERRLGVESLSGDDETTAVMTEMLRGHLDILGPATAASLAANTSRPERDVELALLQLESEGFALRGRFSDPGGPEEFCARRLLARIHAYTRMRRRSEIEPVTPQDFMRFLLRWQHVAAGTRREGSRGVLAVVEQLQGFELAAGSWERSVLGARVTGYQREWLDGLCLSGEVAWGRLSLRDREEPPHGSKAPRGRGITPSRATPITLTIREDLPWLLRAARGDRLPVPPGPGRTADVLDALAERGALFPPDLAVHTGRLPSEIEEALWEAVARGIVTADGFRAVRALLARRLLTSAGVAQSRRGLRRAGQHTTRTGGRWSLLPHAADGYEPDELAEAVAEQLAARWGVVFRDLLVRENIAVPWREVLWAFRRLEARGTIRGGRFVNGFSGEQFAHPDAVDVLREVRKQPRTGETIRLSAVDPLNLIGVILPGARIPAVATNTVTYVDGAIATPEVLTA